MTVILHAGLPKTGTSSIQVALTANRERLAAAGVIYPEFEGADFGGHWQLSVYWTALEDGHLEKRKRREDEAWGGRVRDAISAMFRRAAATGEDLLLSTEALSAIYAEEGCRTLRDEIGALHLPVQVIAYARSPVDLFASHVQQKLKSISKRQITLPSEWTSDHLERAQRLISIFGKDRVRIRIYRRERDVVADFMSWLAGILQRPMPTIERGPDVNTSMSAPACALFALTKFDDLDESLQQTAKALRRQLREFEPTIAAPRLRVPPEWSEIVAANNAENWNCLLGLAETGAADVDALRLPQKPLTTTTIGKAQYLEWLLSYFDEDYVSALRSYCDANLGKNAAAVRAMIDDLAARCRKHRSGAAG